MALAFVQSKSASVDSSTNTVSTAFDTPPTIGNMVVGLCKWEDAAGATLSIANNIGGDAFTMATLNDHADGNLHIQIGYRLVLTSAVDTMKATWSDVRRFKRLHIYEFSYTGTAQFDTENKNTGTSSTAVTSGNITTHGTDEIVLAIYGEESATGRSNPLINGAAPDNQILPAGSPYTTTWEKRFTSTFTAGAALTLGANNPWGCNIIAFNTGSSGGGRTAKNTRNGPLGIGYGLNRRIIR